MQKHTRPLYCTFLSARAILKCTCPNTLPRKSLPPERFQSVPLYYFFGRARRKKRPQTFLPFLLAFLQWHQERKFGHHRQGEEESLEYYWVLAMFIKYYNTAHFPSVPNKVFSDWCPLFFHTVLAIPSPMESLRVPISPKFQVIGCSTSINQGYRKLNISYISYNTAVKFLVISFIIALLTSIIECFRRSVCIYYNML